MNYITMKQSETFYEGRSMEAIRLLRRTIKQNPVGPIIKPYNALFEIYEGFTVFKSEYFENLDNLEPLLNTLKKFNDRQIFGSIDLSNPTYHIHNQLKQRNKYGVYYNLEEFVEVMLIEFADKI